MHVCPIRVKMVVPVPVTTRQTSNAVVLQNILVILVKQALRQVIRTGLRMRGVWRVASGVWRVASGIWRLASGVWRLASGVWRLECDVWRVTCGVWGLASGV